MVAMAHLIKLDGLICKLLLRLRLDYQLSNQCVSATDIEETNWFLKWAKTKDDKCLTPSQ